MTSGLSAEDQTIQSMPDASPTKWRRAHTAWFFESFILVRYLCEYEVFHPHYAYLLNSYYEAVGARYRLTTALMSTRRWQGCSTAGLALQRWS